MKKTFLLAILMVAGFIATNAQPPAGFQFGAGVRVGIPASNFGKTHSLGIGGELQAEYGFSDMVSGIGTTGFTMFLGKKINATGESSSERYEATGYLPVLAGLRVYPAASFFIGAQIGYGMLTGGGATEGVFNYQPQIGYNADQFQFAINYNGLKKKNSITVSHIGLTGIFKF